MTEEEKISGERRSGTTLERHAQTVIGAVVVALLLWVGYTTQHSQIKISEMAIHIQNFHDAFTARDARVEDIVRRVDAIEGTVYRGDKRERTTRN